MRGLKTKAGSGVAFAEFRQLASDLIELIDDSLELGNLIEDGFQAWRDFDIELVLQYFVRLLGARVAARSVNGVSLSLSCRFASFFGVFLAIFPGCFSGFDFRCTGVYT